MKEMPLPCWSTTPLHVHIINSLLFRNLPTYTQTNKTKTHCRNGSKPPPHQTSRGGRCRPLPEENPSAPKEAPHGAARREEATDKGPVPHQDVEEDAAEVAETAILVHAEEAEGVLQADHPRHHRCRRFRRGVPAEASHGDDMRRSGHGRRPQQLPFCGKAKSTYHVIFAENFHGKMCVCVFFFSKDYAKNNQR